jgi:DNA-directed RNA polymerase alpha subunit
MRVCLFLPQLSGKQVAASLRRVILSSVACLAVEHFSTLLVSHKRQDFRNNEVVERKVCVLIFATMFV